MTLIFNYQNYLDNFSNNIVKISIIEYIVEN